MTVTTMMSAKVVAVDQQLATSMTAVALDSSKANNKWIQMNLARGISSLREKCKYAGLQVYLTGIPATRVKLDTVRDSVPLIRHGRLICTCDL